MYRRPLARRVRSFGVVLLSAGLVAGCSSGGSDTAATTMAPKAQTMEERVLSESTALAQGTFEEQVAAISELDGPSLEWFLKATGLSESITPEEARSFYTDLTEHVNAMKASDLGAAEAGQRPPGAKAWRSDDFDLPPGSMSGLVTGWFELFMLGSLGVGAINQDKSDHSVIKDADGTTTIDVSQSGLAFDMNHTKTIKGITAKLANKIAVETCPDAQGVVHIDAKIDSSMYKTDSRQGGRNELSFTVTGQVNDNADLVSSESDFRSQVSDTAENGKGKFVDYGGGIRMTGYDEPHRGVEVSKNIAVNRTGGSITQQDFDAYFKLNTFMMIALQETIIQKAQAYWKSGKCIDLKVTSDPSKRTHLKPSATLKVTATPTAKADGAMAGGTVTADLKGGSSIAPSGKVKAAAAFDYVAPGEKDKEATVAFESRSKRGIGRASASFDTKTAGYTAKGSGPNITITGHVDDVTKPFTLQGTCVGCTASLNFTPTSDKGGTFTSSFSGGGFSGTRTGTYTITGPEGGPLTITTEGSGCVNGVAQSCRSGSETITLTADS